MLRILVIDSHSVVLDQLVARLRREPGIEVCGSGGLPILLSMAEDSAPDVLLVDPQDQNGFHPALLSRFLERHPGTKTIVLTAIVDSSTRLEMERVGVEKIYEKGEGTNDLFGLLASLER